MEIVSATAEQVFIPLTVGGGVGSVADVDRLLRAGADKVAVNTAAIHRPELVAEIADRFGNQVLVLSVDARRARRACTDSGFEVTTHGGRKSAGLDAVAWARRAADLGAGEILLNAMDADGTRDGFDLDLIRLVRGGGVDPGDRLGRGRGRRALPAGRRRRRRRRPRRLGLPLRHAPDRRRQGLAGAPPAIRSAEQATFRPGLPAGRAARVPRPEAANAVRVQEGATIDQRQGSAPESAAAQHQLQHRERPAA